MSVVLSDEVRAKKADHDKILGEALKLQEKYKGQPMPQAVGEEFARKCQEAEALWAEIEPELKSAEERDAQERKNVERADRLARLRAEGKQVVDPTMPATDAGAVGGVAGYVSFSDFVVMSEAFQKQAGVGFRGPVQLGGIPVGIARARKSGLVGPGGVPLVPLTAEERKAFEGATLERKALVTIGAGVIEPTRLPVEARVTGDYRPTIRDVVPVGTTTSNAVSYIREESYTRVAAETTPGSPKPEASLVYSEQVANVRTIPVWIPVTTDQLADWPGLRGRIENRLLYDIEKREAEAIMYGDGTPPNIEGILDVAGTQDIASHSLYNSSNDLLEHVRLGITMVAVAGYQANALVIHPLDWFQMVVLKGTDDHYLGQVFLTADRQPRVWGLDVVEATETEATAGHSTEARNLIVGDFLRGAEILDRMSANVQIGLNSDDFTKNRRTILAEERIAFPIYAPAAFATLETQAMAS